MFIEAYQLVVIALAVFVVWGMFDYLWRNRKE